MPKTPEILTEAQMRSAWQQAQQEAELTTLGRVKAAAAARTAALTAVLGLLATIGFALAPEKLLVLHPTLRLVMAALLLIVIGGAILSQYFASSASSSGIKMNWVSGNGIEYRDYVTHEAIEAARKINKSRRALSAAVAGLIGAAGLYLSASTLTHIFFNVPSWVKTADGTLYCGTVVKNSDGSLWLETGSGQGIRLPEKPEANPTTTCPAAAQTDVTTAGSFYQVKTKETLACGELKRNGRGLLWLKTDDNSAVTPVSGEAVLTAVTACPAIEQFTAPKPQATYTIAKPKQGKMLCGELNTKADGSLALKTEQGEVSLVDNPTLTPTTRCPALTP